MAGDGAPIDRLLAIMARLRDPSTGCEWDRAQTFATIAPYTIEEAYEVADAIDRADLNDLKDELGDLLLQVVFHSRIAEELGAFAFDDVANAISAKLIRRHPHLFTADGNARTSGEQRATWEAIKAAEREAKGDGPVSALDGIPLALPALLRAQKIQERAARVGFDWPNASGPRAKVSEELEELDRAMTPAQQLDEAGDLLFAVVNYLRHLDISAEQALHAATAKFSRRFRLVEAELGSDLEGVEMDRLDEAWNRAKAQER